MKLKDSIFLLFCSILLLACRANEPAPIAPVLSQESIEEATTPFPTLVDATNAGLAATWIRQFGTSLTDEIGDVATDSAGNAYLSCLCDLGAPRPFDSPFTGSVQVIGRAHSLFKVNGEGHVVWQALYDSGEVEADAPVISVDHDGNVAMSLSGVILSSGEYFSYIVKYGSDGKLGWELGLPSHYVSDIALDSDGSIFVAGRSVPESGTGVFTFVRKYNAVGEEEWTETFNPETSVNGLTTRVLVRADGNIVVVGSVFTSLTGLQSLGGTDVFIVTFDPDGEKVWVRQFGTSDDDYIADVLLDGDENLNVAYENGHVTVEKYSPSGTQLFANSIGPEGAEWVRLAADADGNLFILLNNNWPENPTESEILTIALSGELFTSRFPAEWPAAPNWWLWTQMETYS